MATEHDDVSAQTAEMMGLFPMMVRADREAVLRYARARVARFRNDEAAAEERFFSAPIATLLVARNIGRF